jgi:hypothetical protein
MPWQERNFFAIDINGPSRFSGYLSFVLTVQTNVNVGQNGLTFSPDRTLVRFIEILPCTSWVYTTDMADAGKDFNFICTPHCTDGMVGSYHVNPASVFVVGFASLLPLLMLVLSW